MLRIIKGWGKYLAAIALALAFAGLLLAAPVSAASPADPPSPSNPAGKILGVVPTHGQASKNAGSGGNLVYHNGPVMHTNKVYAIYWVPSGYYVSGTYESLINRFYTDVAAANGQTTNVYYSDTQYYDNANGKITYSSSLGGSVVDTNAFPASGCNATYTSGVTVCLTDAQLQAEIQKEITANGWTANSSTEFFMFTAKGVGSCAGSSCAFTQYCAYHSYFSSGSNVVLYANMPYTGTNLSACGVTTSPNNDFDADSTINVASHEHNETITDEQGSAWYDRRGYENGDKCAWNFGSYIGSNAYGSYNQLINADPYVLQQEWSNQTSHCVLQGY